MSHEGIILEYLSDMQDLLDKISLNDDGYDEFLELLAVIIEIHNDNGAYAYNDPLYRDKWYFSLPNMVYWASLGYLAAIETEHVNIDKVILKMAKTLTKTIKKLERMVLINPSFKNDKTLLN
jgi:hypothetical protein